MHNEQKKVTRRLATIALLPRGGEGEEYERERIHTILLGVGIGCRPDMEKRAKWATLTSAARFSISRRQPIQPPST